MTPCILTETSAHMQTSFLILCLILCDILCNVLPQIYIRSTDFDRTLMTAQGVLNGLYPPSGDQEWKEGLDWQPIPIHAVAGGSDVVSGKWV